MLDLIAGFWQMLLETSSRPYTAFTVPGQGQFQWVTLLMGLLGCPASFQRMMEAVVMGLEGIIVYIHNLLVHSDTHEKQINILEQLFQRLVQNGIKANLDKCIFGNKNISYLGFRLTEKGIIPGSDKLKAIRDVAPPSNDHEVRQFLGLCNFFQNHVKNFAQISAPLTALTRKDNGTFTERRHEGFQGDAEHLGIRTSDGLPQEEPPLCCDHGCIIREQRSEETRRFRCNPNLD